MSGSRELYGLSEFEVTKRIQEGRTNAAKEITSRSLWHIIRANVFTRFNAILGSLFVIIMIFGQPGDALFGIVLVLNTLIGIIQELRAKIALDRLSILVAPSAYVLREGKTRKVETSEIVEDDVVLLKSGDQVPVDGIVLESDGLEVDESLITGESVPVKKVEGDQVLSGTIVVAGSGYIEAEKVGQDTYARKLAKEARQFTIARSELREGINLILKYITYIMIPVASILLLSQLKYYGTFVKAVPGVVAGLVGMVPEGLVLLTSVAFAVSVIKLARKNVLVQELPAVETLARVNVICLDKTGTLTDRNLSLAHVEFTCDDKETARRALAATAHLPKVKDSTIFAVAEAFDNPPDWKPIRAIEFSSSRKWSAVEFEGHGAWLLGAPEVLLASRESGEIMSRISEYASSGMRVLLFARAQSLIKGEEIPDDIQPSAILVLRERIRPDAGATLKYFKSQNVSVKIISGDNPETVGAIARQLGVDGAGSPVDSRSLPEDKEELSSWMEKRTVFGRVTPEQKRRMVEALQMRGHVVAMTGDGVNDVLALKKADIGIAMGSGSPASRAVAEVVLLDGRFSTLPGVVAEGRRVIANMERVANLFLTKNVYSTLLSIIISIAGWAFIFLPRHLTLISAITIGTPAFFLSFAPTADRYRPGFLKRILSFSIPVGLVVAASAFIAGSLSHAHQGVPFSESRTMATLAIAIIGTWIIFDLARPLSFWKGLLLAGMIIAIFVAFTVPFFLKLFALQLPGPGLLLQTFAIAGVGVALVELIWRLTGRKKWMLANVE